MTVLRVRLVAIAFLVAFAVGLGFLPMMFVLTFVTGGTATARVTACRHGRHLDCSGRWQDAQGRRGEGHISGVGDGDVGRNVKVRIGPLGPYAGGPARSWPMLLTAIPFLLGPPFVVVALRRALTPGRTVARRLLAEAPGDATLLSVPHTWADGGVGVTDPDGRPWLSFATIDAPAGYQPADLPGRRPRLRQRSVFDAAAGIARSSSGFAAATDPGGSPMFAIEDRSFAEYEPETWLLDVGRMPQAVIRRLDVLPRRFELLRADGVALGVISTYEGLRSGAYVTLDAEGRRVASMAAHGRRWVVRVEHGTPPLLRDLTLVFLLDVGRLQL